MILGANRLLGVPRMRLLRVRNDSCIVPNDFKEAITVSLCFVTFKAQTESKLFELFSSNLDIIVSREDILSAVWGKSDYHTGRCMDVYICKPKEHICAEVCQI